MECIACGHEKTQVNRTTMVHSGSRKNAVVMRERHCPNCSLTFTTEETMIRFKVLNPITLKVEWYEPGMMPKLMDTILGKKQHPSVQGAGNDD